MVDFSKLMRQPALTDAEREELWKAWYEGLSPEDKAIVDKERKRGLK